jgi:hypothetical protein
MAGTRVVAAAAVAGQEAQQGAEEEGALPARR